MEVYPNSIVIPPHEYRHVTLAFCPRALQQYSATFEAVAVCGAADTITAGFVCELRGEGALPSLNFQVGVGGVGSLIVAVVACMPHCVSLSTCSGPQPARQSCQRRVIFFQHALAVGYIEAAYQATSLNTTLLSTAFLQ